MYSSVLYGAGHNFKIKIVKMGGFITKPYETASSKMVHLGPIGDPFCETELFVKPRTDLRRGKSICAKAAVA